MDPEKHNMRIVEDSAPAQIRNPSIRVGNESHKTKND